jgi:hypothetical protein
VATQYFLENTSAILTIVALLFLGCRQQLQNVGDTPFWLHLFSRYRQNYLKML